MGALALLLALAAGSPPQRLLDGWQFRWGDSPRDEAGRLVWLDPAAEGWAPLQMPGYPKRGESEAVRLWLRVPLPELPWRDPVIKIDAVVGGSFDLYLGDQLLYQFPAD